MWQLATNELSFINSFKMKLAVLIGIVHMSAGVCIKAVNARFFKQRLDFYFEFIPQILFLILTFGYMDFLIIKKWLTDWTQVLVDG